MERKEIQKKIVSKVASRTFKCYDIFDLALFTL